MRKTLDDVLDLARREQYLAVVGTLLSRAAFDLPPMAVKCEAMSC